MSEKINAYSYLRISTDAQKVGDGVRRQIEAGEKYAAEQGYELVETISDLGVSGFKGKNAKEGAFSRFLAAIDDGTVAPGSVLIVESLDRLSRAKVLEAFSQFSSILIKGITIVTLVDNQVYTAESVSQNPGQLFMSLGIMLRANDESATKANRMRAVWKEKRANLDSKKLTSRIPAWLELSKEKTDFIVKEDAAETVRAIFEMSANGMGVYSIARHMNSNLEKYPTIADAERWNNSYVSKILHNKAVFGCFQPNVKEDGKRTPTGEAIPDYYPAIITEEQFHLVQSRLADRRVGSSGRKGDSFSNLFTGFTTCGKCGDSITLKNKGKPPKGYKYLRCHNSILNNGCRCPAWRYNEFEDAFVAFVREVNFADVFAGEGTQSKLANLEAQKAAANAKLSELKASYEALLSRFEDPALPETLITRLVARSETLRTEVEALELELEGYDASISALAAENVEQDKADFLAEYTELQNTNDPERLREIRFQMHSILKRTLDEVVIHNGETVNPWDAIDHISDKLGEELFARGYNTEEKLETFFSKPHGQRAYDHSERFFVVRFKNGVIRVVHPYQNATYMAVDERLAKMKSRQKA